MLAPLQTKFSVAIPIQLVVHVFAMSSCVRLCAGLSRSLFVFLAPLFFSFALLARLCAPAAGLLLCFLPAAVSCRVLLFSVLPAVWLGVVGLLRRFLFCSAFCSLAG